MFTLIDILRLFLCLFDEAAQFYAGTAVLENLRLIRWNLDLSSFCAELHYAVGPTEPASAENGVGRVGKLHQRVPDSARHVQVKINTIFL